MKKQLFTTSTRSKLLANRRAIRNLRHEMLEDRRVMAADTLSVFGLNNLASLPESQRLYFELAMQQPEFQTVHAEALKLQLDNSTAAQARRRVVEQRLSRNSIQELAAVATPSIVDISNVGTSQLLGSGLSVGTSLSNTPGFSQTTADFNPGKRLTEASSKLLVHSNQTTVQSASDVEEFVLQKISSIGGLSTMGRLQWENAGNEPIVGTHSEKMAKNASQSVSSLPETKLQPVNDNELLQISGGNFLATLFPPKKISNGFNALSVNSEILDEFFWVCTTDGSHRRIDSPAISTPLFAEGEGSGNSAGMGIGSSDEDWGIPLVEFPDIQIMQHVGSLYDFIPQELSSFSTTNLRGNLSNQGSGIPGSNWIHTVTLNRTPANPGTWTYTEFLDMNFLAVEANLESGGLEDLWEDPDPDEDDWHDFLMVQGGWSNQRNNLRAGFIRLTFNAYRTAGTATANYTAWNISFSFMDYVVNHASVSAGSTMSVDPALTSGANPEIVPPLDLTGSAAWTGDFFSTKGYHGVINATGYVIQWPSSIVPNPNPIVLVTFSNGQVGVGSAHSGQENWNRAAQTGNLSRTQPLPGGVSPELAVNNPLPLGGREEIDYTAQTNSFFNSVPNNANTGTDWNGLINSEGIASGLFDGNGTASASSGNLNSNAQGTLSRQWGIASIQIGAELMAFVGQVEDGLESEINGDGRNDDRLIVRPIDHTEPLGSGPGFKTYSGQLYLGWGDQGAWDSELNARVTSTVRKGLGNQLQIITDVNGAITSSNGNSSGSGGQFTALELKVTTVVHVSEITLGVPCGGTEIWYPHTTIDNYLYLSRDNGHGQGTSLASTTSQAPVDANAIAKWKSSGFEVLKRTTSESLDGVSCGYSPEIIAATFSIQRSTGDNSLLIGITRKEDADLTAVLVNDTPQWGGSATRVVNGQVDYAYKTDKEFDWTGTPSLNPDYFVYRQASFNQRANSTATFNVDTQQFDEQVEITGDVLTLVEGTTRFSENWFQAGPVYTLTRAENVLFPFITSVLPEELQLENIFTPWVVEPVEDPEEPQNPDPGPPPRSASRSGSFSASEMFYSVVGWFGGSAGDGFDQGMNFLAGAADAITPTSWLVRKGVGLATGYDGADEESTAYTVGEVGGTVVSLVIPGGGLLKVANKFDDAGRCANALTSFYHGACFVSGTRVTVSELPYSSERQEMIWDGDSDWLSDSTGSLTEPESSVATSRYLQLPIEQVPLGARVPTKNPKPWEYDDSLPEPVQAEWAKVSITVTERKGSPVDIELLRPRAWIARHGLVAGGRLPMNVPELQVDGVGLVTAIEDCPEIAGGEGSVVTGRFVTREANDLARITVARLSESVLRALQAEGRGPSGLTTEELTELANFGLIELETLDGTDRHPVWSEDRQDWVPLGKLQAGETLRASYGPAIVLSVTILNQLVPVYNIEVHGEHVYQVGELGLLVHNSCEGTIGYYSSLRKLIKGTELQAHHLIEKRFRKLFGQKASEMLSQALTATDHQVFTNHWRRVIPYGSGTANATKDTVIRAAREVYSKHPEILNALGL